MNVGTARTLTLLYAPALLWAAAALTVDVVSHRIGSGPFTVVLAPGLVWAELLALAALAFVLITATWRYAQWEKGDAPACGRCGGLLGREQRGRYGPFRRCLACGGAERVQDC